MGAGDVVFDLSMGQEAPPDDGQVVLMFHITAEQAAMRLFQCFLQEAADKDIQKRGSDGLLRYVVDFRDRYRAGMAKHCEQSGARTADLILCTDFGKSDLRQHFQHACFQADNTAVLCQLDAVSYALTKPPSLIIEA